jgi:hypothetical protein
VKKHAIRGLTLTLLSLLFLILFILVPNRGFAGSLIIDTRGYASGQLSKLSRERTFSSAVVGEVFLGTDSVSFISLGNQPPGLVSNPWRFCIDEDEYEDLENLIGSNIVVKYKTPRRSALLNCSATHELVEIYPVIKDQSLDETQLVGDIRTFAPEVSYGVEFGRITNAIENRNKNRSYFMTLQVGNNGNKFRHFVTDDPNLYDFAVESLKIAAKVRVHYSDRFSSRTIYGYNVRSFVSEIEIVE